MKPIEPPHITQEEFLEWRSPRFGTENPSLVSSSVWSWLIESKHSAYTANNLMGGPSPSWKSRNPCWCFDRMGQSVTTLNNGDTVYIAGEHEDGYDPDFYIYNDIVVKTQAGEILIYSYPREIFRPTDFHSATLWNNKIVIIGCLGYPEDRIFGYTPVYLLNLDNYEISRVETSGENPGWISNHQATICEDGKHIEIACGNILRSGDRPERENFDQWRLSLLDWTWCNITKNPWTQFQLMRKDMLPVPMWELRRTLWYSSVNWQEDYEKSVHSLEQQLGFSPSLDEVERLYDINGVSAFESENEEESRVLYSQYAGSTVKITEDSFYVEITIQGPVDKESTDYFVQAIKSNFENFFKTEFVVLF